MLMGLDRLCICAGVKHIERNNHLKNQREDMVVQVEKRKPRNVTWSPRVVEHGFPVYGRAVEKPRNVTCTFIFPIPGDRFIASLFS
jgi:hypothetical protein